MRTVGLSLLLQHKRVAKSLLLGSSIVRYLFLFITMSLCALTAVLFAPAKATAVPTEQLTTLALTHRTESAELLAPEALLLAQDDYRDHYRDHDYRDRYDRDYDHDRDYHGRYDRDHYGRDYHDRYDRDHYRGDRWRGRDWEDEDEWEPDENEPDEDEPDEDENEWGDEWT